MPHLILISEQDTLQPYWMLSKTRVYVSPVGSSQRFKNWHLLLTWLAFAIKALEQGWLAQCQFNVTVWGIMFICGMLVP